ncbi:hypothetical protein P7H75_05750 [Vagococcus carniphilus]|uniref:hypothetical protein n=1 Tax=Vagococcus carniphilus TaxID=218144 RepID=UPI00289240C0|nr:hypothetical protein [Vagococcus carniphilus]MDT2814343.1 hypothetical protein [Vagococcus carniphilus]
MKVGIEQTYLTKIKHDGNSFEESLSEFREVVKVNRVIANARFRLSMMASILKC